MARMGASGMNSVCPVWDGMFAIRDEITGRKSGQISITIGMLAGFDILRAGGFHAAQIQGRLMGERLEYRFAALEFRDSGAVIEGIAMPYGTEARPFGLFTERVEAGSFAFDDVILNTMHQRAEPIARTGRRRAHAQQTAPRRCGSVPIFPTTGQDIRDMVSRRILRGFSVEMDVTAEDWPAPDQRIIRAATLTGIGLVDRPAYSKATAAIAQRMKAMPDGQVLPLPALGGVSPLRRWAEQHLVVADGPMSGARFTAGGGGQGTTTMPCWREPLDAMDDDRDLEQVTIRGSVQSGKTASIDRRCARSLRGRAVGPVLRTR